MRSETIAGSGRLACFVNSLRGGGAEGVIATLANCFAADGWPVDMVLGRAYGPHLKRLDDDVRLVDLGTTGMCTGFLRLAKYLVRERPQVMLSTNVMSNCAAIMAKRLLRLPTRIVIREGNYLSRSLEHQRRHASASVRWSARMAPHLYRHADAVIAVANDVARDLVDRFRVPAGSVHAIESPILTDTFARASQESAAHPWFDEPTPVLLGVGRLSRQKDFATLIKAYAKVREQRPCRLMILGEGEARAELERLIADLRLGGGVELPGYVENPCGYMKRAAVFVLSSAWEGLPAVLVQAMACCCPIVSTRCPGGTAQVLDDGRFGSLVEVENPNAMADAILRAMDAPRQEVPEAWLSRYTPESTVPAYLEVLRPGRDPRATA